MAADKIYVSWKEVPDQCKQCIHLRQFLSNMSQFSYYCSEHNSYGDKCLFFDDGTKVYI